MVEERTVEIIKSPTKGFGFSVIGGSNTHLPPMICSLLHDSPAANSGKIGIGDVIHRVDGVNTKKLPTREIKEIVHNSKGKLVLTLVQDPEAKKLAKPFLSKDVVLSTPKEGRAVRVTSGSSDDNTTNIAATLQSPSPQSPDSEILYAWNRSEKGKKSEKKSDKSPDKNPKKTGLSRKYKRTVGSPDYDRLGADGKFVKSGSFDRKSSNFTFDPETISTEDKESSESDTVSGQDSLDDKYGETTSQKSDDQQIDSSNPDESYTRLSNPLFGSAPRLHWPPTSQDKMKQNAGYNNLPYYHDHAMQRPSNHRRSASHDEQTLNLIQRQQNSNEYRTQYYPASNQNGLDANRGVRNIQTVRFHDNSNQGWEGSGRQNGGGLPSNGVTVHRTNSYADGKSTSNAQELRNAFVKHQIALRNQKLAGFSQRRYNSSEELQVRDYSFRPIRQNGPIQNARGMPPMQIGQNDGYNDNHVDDDDDLQQSGYGVGFRRTNSFGQADLQRFNRNQDFVYNDRIHPNQYTNNRDESNLGLQISRLSPALQLRLKNVMTSSMTSSAGMTSTAGMMSSMGMASSMGANHVTSSQGTASQGASNFDGYNQQTERFQTNQFTQRDDHYNLSPSSSYNVDYGGYNGVAMRDTEDGMVHSRYEHGKSLAVPIQQFPEDYFAATNNDNHDVYDRKRGSFSSRNSAGARLSEMGGNVNMTSPNKIPNDLKTIDATDLATKLFTLDGFTSDDVAPFLGKNTDFSQQVCNEYMKFFNFEGFAIDEALRMLLQKFPVTGETQERERILLQFSKRYHECNGQLYGSEDSVHTLTCALMLLNTDLHGQNIGTKMTLNDFVNNLSGMCDGQDFSRELLKTLYQSIKNKEILYAKSEVQKEMKPSPKVSKPSSGGNPFIELKAHDDAVVMREGMMLRKCIMETDGKRLSAMKRRWKAFYCTLKGLVLSLQKPEKGPGEYSIGIHHSLAGFATEYKKKKYVFKLITSDWSVFMFEAKNRSDVQDWVDSINLSAAALSSPPLPAPCSSSKQFIRPVMPVSVTKQSLDEQIKRHSERAESIDKDKQEHRAIQPDENSKDFKEWENKMDYLEFEYKRFSAYAKVLCMPRLKEQLRFLLSNRDKAVPVRMEEAPSNKPLRSSSMNDIGNSQYSSPNTRRRMRQSYLQAVHHKVNDNC